MKFREDTSFPFLKIARELDVPYERVLETERAIHISLFVTGNGRGVDTALGLDSPLGELTRRVFRSMQTEAARRLSVAP